MSKNGKNMSEEMYESIQSILPTMNIDMNTGIITTPRGTNGTLCSSTGYLRVKVNKKLYQVHQILAVCYFGKSCIGNQVHHKDDDKLNNTRDNLGLLTHSDHTRQHGYGKVDYLSAYRTGKKWKEAVKRNRITSPPGKSWCRYGNHHTDIINFTKDKNRWNGLHQTCRQCRKLERAK